MTFTYLEPELKLKRGIYLAGGWGYGNRGDNAIFEAMLQTLRTAYPEEPLLITSYAPKETKAHHDLDAIPSVHARLALRKPLSWLRWLAVGIWRTTGYRWMPSPSLAHHISCMKQAKVVLFGGGGYFNDAWPDMLRSMYVAIEMAKTAKTPVVVYGQTVGPFSDKTISESLATALKGVKRVAYRDIQSKRVLDKAGVPESKCIFTADEANLIAFKAWRRPKELDGVKILVGVMTQEFRPHLGTGGASPKGRICNSEAYERELVKTLADLSRAVDGIGYLFIPSTTWDEKQCARIHERTVRSGIEKAAFLSNSMTKDFIGACQSVDVMLSTNMHPIILAATAAKPCIAISYHYKLDDYMTSIGLEEFVVRIDSFDSTSLCSKIVRAIDQRTALASVVSQKHRLVRAKASHNLSALREALQ